MARIVATIDPSAAERQAVERILSDIEWAVDGAKPDADALLSFMPRREFRDLGWAWSDTQARLLQLCSAGANHVPWSELPAGMQVAVAPGGSASAVAEHVLAMTLWWSRRLGEHDADIRAGRFRNGAPVTALSELRVLIVGHGGIGQTVGRSFTHFGAAVRAVSRTPNAPHVAPMKRLDEGIAWADVVVLSLPLTPATRGLIDARRLALMAGRRCLVVNVARGPIIDEKALFEWLHVDRRHHAALDVWWRYPEGPGKPFTEPFETLPNVLMTPHDAPNVRDFRVPMLHKAAEQLAHWRATGEVLHAVTRDEAELPGDDR